MESHHELELNLQCGQCTLRYSTQQGEKRLPKVLPCGHTFCSTCVKHDSSEGSKCPRCEAEYDPDKLTTNNALIGVVIVMGAMGHGDCLCDHECECNSDETVTKRSPGSIVADHVARAGKKILGVSSSLGARGSSPAKYVVHDDRGKPEETHSVDETAIDSTTEPVGMVMVEEPKKKVKIKADKSPLMHRGRRPSLPFDDIPAGSGNAKPTCDICGAKGTKNSECYAYCVDCAVIMCPVCAEESKTSKSSSKEGTKAHSGHHVYEKSAATECRKRRIMAEKDLVIAIDGATHLLVKTVEKHAPQYAKDFELRVTGITDPLQSAIQSQEHQDWTNEVEVNRALNNANSAVWHGIRALNKHVRRNTELSGHLQEYWERMHHAMRVYAAERMGINDRGGYGASYACCVM